jgi:hypothetical protein
MKPTSYEEAKTMRDIIQTFRIASSPRGQGSNTSLKAGSDSKSAEDIEALAKANKDKSPEEQINAFDIADAAELLGDNGLSPAPLTFGYPDMCKLELILYHNDKKEITVLFQSDFCMIENVGLDYGASNKMVFLAPPKPELGGKADYFPSEVNMTIALRESVLVTAEYASGQGPVGSGITIF